MSKTKKVYVKVIYINPDGKEEDLDHYEITVSSDPLTAIRQTLYWEEEYIKTNIRFEYETIEVSP